MLAMSGYTAGPPSFLAAYDEGCIALGTFEEGQYNMSEASCTIVLGIVTFEKRCYSGRQFNCRVAFVVEHTVYLDLGPEKWKQNRI